MPPKPITNIDGAFIAAVTNTGHLLVFPLKELPALSKGKGNKILTIPTSKVQSREEFIIDINVLDKTQTLIVASNNKQVKLKPQDWKLYIGERGRRGNKLPSACRNITALLVAKE